MNCLQTFSTPQLQKLHSGKVRDSYKIDEERRLIVVTDRISAFNKNSKTPIPHKGAVLNSLANFWFKKTEHIVPNHVIKAIDPNMTLVHEAQAIKVEMIVRGFLTGSMWRGYEKGERSICGLSIPDGMQKNQAFDSPILTPTTKDEDDTNISPEAIVANGLVSQDTYDKMAAIALQLFDLGSKHAAERGLILVDTKYEFGILNGDLILIDEIHTPDSSRFWRASEYQEDPRTSTEVSKEYVRQWLLENKQEGKVPDRLPENVVQETSRLYQEIYEILTDEKLPNLSNEDINDRLSRNLVNEGFIREGYVAIIMGSPSDLEHCQKIHRYLQSFPQVATEFRVISAHKNGEEILKAAHTYNNSVEPGAVIAVAGRSNGLGGALAANLNLPVINCPPFKDSVDLQTNVNSSLVMPSKTPATTAVHPDNAAYAALRSLNIPSVRRQMSEMIRNIKQQLKEADQRIREEQWIKEQHGLKALKKEA